MRDRERETFKKLGWHDVERRLTHEVASSILCYTGLADGRTILIYGAKTAGVLSDEAYVWMVGTTDMAEYPITIARHSRAAIDLLQQNFRRLYGLVLSDFGYSVRWLCWCGFTVDPPVDGVCKFRIN